MDWRVILADTNLIWSTLSVALTGLVAAASGGWWLKGLVSKETIDQLKSRVADLARLAAEKDQRIQELNAQFATEL
jgi:outer membrane murein-binding lipoprotein Lpp